MSTAKAHNRVLTQLSAAGTVLFPVVLDLPTMRPWCDGQLDDGRVVSMVGQRLLGETKMAREAVASVMDTLRTGELPAGCRVITYRPKASEAFAQIVDGDGDHILIDGPRASGKTIIQPGALMSLAELHLRAGFPLPLKVLWLHDTLSAASEKTGASLSEHMWGGCWSLEDDSRKAVFTLGGVRMIEARFVGCLDGSASELLRAAAHVILCEELVRTQDDAGGISEQDYEIATSSMIGRLPTRRHVAVSTTNPGSPRTWVFRRWLEHGGLPRHVRCQVPGADRLTPEEVEKLRVTYSASPELQKRLAEGEWVALILGKAVAEGFTSDLHVATQRLHPIAGEPLFLGVDFGLTPAVCIGQPIQGFLRIYASLPCARGGIKQHFEQTVIPWIARWAGWALRDGVSYVRAGYDPAGETAEETDSERNPLALAEALLPGIWTPGPVRWPARNNILMAALNRHVGPGQPALQLDPEDCAPLIEALHGGWHYGTNHDGEILRDLPKKPNHPAEDLGDSFVYLLSEMLVDPVTPAS
ncbi:MAG: hypothetical protein V3S71_06975, partial [Acidobacteriota bacterium]